MYAGTSFRGAKLGKGVFFGHINDKFCMTDK